jgi:transposase
VSPDGRPQGSSASTLKSRQVNSAKPRAHQAARHVVAGVIPPQRLISNELWALVGSLIPPRKPAVHGRTGHPRTSDRVVLEGIAFVLSTGIGWAKLPTELGYGSGWTCWRRMHEWAEAGVFDQLRQSVLD